jgi:hypothetical protein
MNNSVNLIAFGTFGNPNGFTQTFFAGNPNVSKNVKTFDIRGAILIYPNSTLYSIRKEHKNGYNMIAYSIYTYAQEPTSTRGGSFIGSSILFVDKIAEENIIINNLNEFHNNLTNKNVQDDVIMVNHSENFDVKNCKPVDFDKVNFHLREIDYLNFAQTTNKVLIVSCYTTPNELKDFFKKSIDLLNVYDTIYFSQNREVIEFSLGKGIFKVVDEKGFQNEIQKLAEERLRKIEASIDNFRREKQKLEDDRKRIFDEYKKQIEHNEKQHQENKRKIEESKNELNSINQKYEAYSKKIDESINRLKVSDKLDSVLQIHNENKRNFIDSINRKVPPDFLNSIPKPNTKTDLTTSPQPLQAKGFYEDNYDQEKQSKGKRGIDVFIVTTLALLLLWIGTLVYFLIFNKPEKETVYTNEQQETTTKAENIPSESTSIQELNPKPNGELSENDYRLVAKKIKYNTSVSEVVEIIFNNNPTDIKSHYGTQKEIYSKQLIYQNQNCFEDKNGIFYFAKDTLKHIPSYKSQ